MSWNDAETKFAEAFRGYEPRLSQRGGAQAIESAWADGQHVLIQAPTGVGKSFLGSVPSVDASFASGLPSVIFTANRTQQDQYIRDLTALAKIYKPFTFAIAKGRGAYICAAKLNEADLVLDGDLDALKTELSRADAAGDMDQVQTVLTPADRMKLSTSSEECPGRTQCPFGAVCFAERNKENAKTAQVIVTSHALGILDAQIKAASGTGGAAILPQYGHRLIDEAHELESYATSMLGAELTERQVLRLLTDVAVFLESKDAGTEVLAPVQALFAQLDQMLTKAKESALAIDPGMLLAVAEPLSTAVAHLRTVYGQVQAADVFGDDEKAQRKKRLLKRIGAVGLKLANVLKSGFSDMVRWVERASTTTRGRTTSYLSLKYAPLSVADDLRAMLWESGVPTALMSATLAVGNDFSFMCEQLGLPANTRSYDAPTPFDFQRQAMIYIPMISEPTRGTETEWQSDVTFELATLAKAAQGRTLALFTAKSEMERAFKVVAPQLAELGLPVIKQGDASNQVLRDRFTAEEHTSLFGMKSFGTGFDVQGRSLEVLFVNKLPFPNGRDIIFQARCDLIDSKATRYPDKSFNKLWIPVMALDLLQWVGRAVRSSSDRSLIVIADPRLFNKSYGRKILAALPNAPVTRDRDVALAYLRSLDEHGSDIAVAV